MSFRFIFKTIRVLLRHKPGKGFLLVLITLFQSLTSGFTIVMLIPLLQLLNVGSEGLPQGITHFFKTLSSNLSVEISIGSVLAVYVVLLSLNAFLNYWKSLMDASYQASLIHDIRLRLFRKVIHADWLLLSSRSKTNHLQILTKEIPVVANYYFYLLRLFISALSVVVLLGYSVLISPGYTLIITVSGIGLFLILSKFLVKSFLLGEQVVDSYNRLLKNIDDFWQSVKIAKVHSSEDFYYRKFDEANSSILDIEQRIQKNYVLPQLIYRIAGILVLVAIIYIGFKAENLPLASFFILIILFGKIYPHFTGINTDLSMIISYLPSVKLVFNLDEELPEFDNSVIAGEKFSGINKEIRLEHITFSHQGGGILFKDFTAVIPTNRITGVTGESGIGKTTLIDIIAGLQKPDEGKILIDEAELDESLKTQWKLAIGYLPQDPFFIDGSFRENLLWDSNYIISDGEILNMLERVNALHLLNRFDKGLDSVVVNFSSSFSGGECQRLALARVLLRKPRLLLLDEATSSLDADNEILIMDLIKEISKSLTIIFVTHRLNLRPYFHNEIRLS